MDRYDQYSSSAGSVSSSSDLGSQLELDRHSQHSGVPSRGTTPSIDGYSESGA